MSDIHGNLEAYTAVLADVETAGADRIALLGDIVGYGPDPEACVELTRELGLASVVGNHELGLSKRGELAWFNPTARRSLEQSMDLLSPASLEWLAALPTFLVLDDCRLVHGAPPDSPRTYYFQLDRQEILRRMDLIDEPLCLVGHTHELALAHMPALGGLERLKLGEGARQLKAGDRYLVNVGAVGQPRDGDNRAKYVIVDQQAGTLEVRCVPYEVQTTVDKIRRLGLPEFNATRLL
ncbi:MAG: metallophosphoesterase family protein [Proteobacteria bacterium]|nr:metallophosphoesterase family protein [Pseudomonadota bacterium]MBU1450586.1 metallophosphoesterase family protein [Pseudomonadota bacterium]MBU2469165.1 metallophosphoesterase family protein [Pseudomonadota bacterium]MBU2516903.1 metallophosphoesterase family protein [Pseudomonadota bacterium]